MKKGIINGFFATAILLFASCSNDNETLSIVTEDATIEKIEKISESFYNKGTIQRKGLPKWVKVVMADVGATLTSASDGDKVGVAVSKGSAASKSKHNEQKAKSAKLSNSDVANSIKEVTKVAHDYDYIGYYHYSTIDHVSQEDSTDDVFDNTKYYYASSEFLLENKLITEEDLKTFTLDKANEALTFNEEILNKYGFVGSLDYQYESGSINENVYKVMRPYFSVINETTNVEEFVSYSYEVESIITSSELKEDSKKQILASMATARYGVQYWSINMEEE